ncbi:MAG: hypothetical protein QOH17_1115, partial [Pseudonocardiales bacterium]|nr:hypothetical protein [Pseudonocardiales bacterium]
MADDPERARRKPPTPGSDDVLARLGLTGTGAAGTAGGRAARRRAAEEAERSPDSPAAAPESAERGRTNGGGPTDPRRTAAPTRADADRIGRRPPNDRTGDLTPADRTNRSAPTGRIGGRALIDRAGPPAGRPGDSTSTNRDRPAPTDRAAHPAPTDGAGRAAPAGHPDQADWPTRVLPVTTGRPLPATPPTGPRRPSTGGTHPAAPPGARPRSSAGGLDDATRAVRRPDAAQASRGASASNTAAEVRRIDETLTRMTLAHAGLNLDGKPDEPEEELDDRPPRLRPSLLRLIALAVTAVVVAAGGVGWGAQRWLGSAVRTAAALDPGSGAIVDPAKQAGAENVLVVATDRAATPGAAARPDTVVVAHLSPSAAKGAAGPLTVLSIPTDLEVSRPPCERYDAASATYTTDTVPAQARTQLASALDLGGPRCATRAVQQLTGLAITRYVGIDLDRLGAAVDAVSGVRVCTPRAVVDASLGSVAPTPGSVSL